MTALHTRDIFAFLRRHVTVSLSVTSKRFAVAGDSAGSYRQIFVKSHISTEKSLQQRMETLLKNCS